MIALQGGTSTVGTYQAHVRAPNSLMQRHHRTLLLLLTRNMQGPSLYSSFFPYLRTRMQKACTRKLHLRPGRASREQQGHYWRSMCQILKKPPHRAPTIGTRRSCGPQASTL